jgi:hypothetical protein
MRQIDANFAMKRNQKARVASDAELMRLVCDSIQPKSQQRDDLKDAFPRKEAEALDWRRIAKLAGDGLESLRGGNPFGGCDRSKAIFYRLGKMLVA